MIMCKCVVLLCVLSSATYIVASDEVNKANKGKQRNISAPRTIPERKSHEQKNGRFIKLQYPPQLEPSNNLLTVCAYGRYAGGISSEENSPRDELSY
jgi:hypothetical protein